MKNIIVSEKRIFNIISKDTLILLNYLFYKSNHVINEYRLYFLNPLIYISDSIDIFCLILL